MALAMALSLAGLEEQDFRGLISVFSPDSNRRRSYSDSERTSSPSAQSVSSGISSLILSTIGSSYGRPSSLSSFSPRSETTDEDIPKVPTKAETLLQALHKKRDILNLAENLSDRSWNMKSASIPHNDTKSLMANGSIHHRLGENALEEDYPVRTCQYCGFTEPSPYLFRD